MSLLFPEKAFGISVESTKRVAFQQYVTAHHHRSSPPEGKSATCGICNNKNGNNNKKKKKTLLIILVIFTRRAGKFYKARPVSIAGTFSADSQD